VPLFWSFAFPPPGGWGRISSAYGYVDIPSLDEIHKIRTAFEKIMNSDELDDLHPGIKDCLLKAWLAGRISVVDRDEYPCNTGPEGAWTAIRESTTYDTMTPLIIICRYIDENTLVRLLAHELAHLCKVSEVEAAIIGFIAGIGSEGYTIEDIERDAAFSDRDWREQARSHELGFMTLELGEDPDLASGCVYRGLFILWNCKTGEVWEIDPATGKRGNYVGTFPGLVSPAPDCCFQ
jgi:hypothetical protein